MCGCGDIYCYFCNAVGFPDEEGKGEVKCYGFWKWIEKVL